MSQSRKLFARTPRGGNKQTPATAGGNREAIVPVRIDRGYLQRFNEVVMDSNLSTVMTKVDGKLDISVSAAGHVEMHMIGANNEVLADKRDLNAIVSMNAELQQQRKEAEKDQASSTVQKLFMALLDNATPHQVSAMQAIKSTEVTAIINPLQSRLKVLKTNIERVDESSEEAVGKSICQYMQMTNTRIRNAIGRFCISRIVVGDKDKKLNDFLFENHVPTWVYNRLTTQKLEFKAGGIRTVFFPKDVTKGFTLTIKEIRSNAFCANQGAMLSSMAWCRTFVNSRSVLTTFGLIDETDLDDEADFITKYGNVPIMVIPPALRIQDVLSAMKDTTSRGLSWDQGRSMRPKDMLKFLGTIPKRVAYLAVPQPRQQYQALGAYIGDFTYNPRSEVSTDVYTQMADSVGVAQAVNYGAVTEYEDQAQAHLEARIVMYRTLCLILGVQEESEVQRAVLRDTCGIALQENGQLGNRGDRLLLEALGQGMPAIQDVWGRIIESSQNITTTSERGRSFLTRLEKTVRTKKEIEVNFSNVRTGIHSAAKAFLKMLKGRPALQERLSLWLSGFISWKVQSAVAELLTARFSTMFKGSIEFDTHDYRGIEDFSDGESSEEEGPPDEEDADADDGESIAE